jgi:large subunit ribosomal protein L47
MRAIKHALTERFYAWEDAVKIAEDDPEVDLSGQGTPFTPSQYLAEEELEGTEPADMKTGDGAVEGASENTIKAEPTSRASQT